MFVEGYWDYPLGTRGVLFAPVYFTRQVYVQPTYVYTPTYVVAEPMMVGALFVRRGYGSYYFGDYYDRRYVGIGCRCRFVGACAPTSCATTSRTSDCIFATAFLSPDRCLSSPC